MMVIIDFVMHIVQCVSDIISAILLGVLGLWFIGIIILMTLAVIEWIRECLKPSEPTKRQRIEWMQMFPDEILDDYERQAFRCCNCKFYNACEDEKKSSNAGHIAWWHEVATLEQFRKDVGM